MQKRGQIRPLFAPFFTSGEKGTKARYARSAHYSAFETDWRT